MLLEELIIKLDFNYLSKKLDDLLGEADFDGKYGYSTIKKIA